MAVASSTYTVAVIPAPSGLTIYNMVGINDSGQVAGTGSIGATRQAFIGSPSGSTAIPGGYSYANGINDSGQVVGSGNTQAFIGTVAGITLIPLPAGWTSAGGTAVNASGQVVGTGGTSGSGPTSQAFIGTVSGSTAIPLPAGWSSAAGQGVNASGQVTGYGANGTASSQAYIGTISGSTAVPMLAGWSFTQGVAINDSGQIAGFAFAYNGAEQAFIGTTSASTAIPLPIGATHAWLTPQSQSINNLGTVVGGSDAGAWIWDASDGTVLLGDLVPVEWNNVTDAISVSNNGRILASASYMGGPPQLVELIPTSCSFSLNPPSISFGANAGSSSLAVTTASECNWQAVSDSPWLTITAGSSGTGNGTVNFNVGANTGFFPRVGTLIVGGQTFTVNQAPIPPAPPTLILPANGATGVSLAPTVSWSASVGATSYDVYFSTLTPPSYVTNTTGTSYAPSTLLANQKYHWQIVAKNGGGTSSSAEWSFTTLCTYQLGSNEVTMSAGTGSDFVMVIAAHGCPWTAVSTANWVFITSGSGIGNGTFPFQVTANSGGYRSTEMGVAGQGLVVNQLAHRLANITDFDGDGSADLAIFRPSTGLWSIQPSSVSGPSIAAPWGVPGDISVVGDFDGDKVLDFAVYRPSTGTWYIIPSSTGVPYAVGWGLPGDVPIAADYDGDGKTDLAVWRPSNQTWYVIPSSNPNVPIVKTWGIAGDQPVQGDFDGDGKKDFAVFRPSTGAWYIIPSSTGVAYGVAWGIPGDEPVPADFDGDGKTDLAVYRSSAGTWYVIPSSSGMPTSQNWGLPGDLPVLLDYDGDHKADFSVYRPSNQTWYVIQSSTGTAVQQQYGNPNDIPLYRPWPWQ
jgi:Viral BACON domain